ncbi:erythromycin esterase family protein [Streptomyces sp. NPDC090025]|uniref:erythromycin esterase family protein n=1 Tax=Streptomyces sp. NPDC090025 TaxID=3365922 RepID=UPI003835CEE9
MTTENVTTAAPDRAPGLLEPLDAAAVLRLLPGRPRLLALGEPTHGEETLLRLRNDLFRELAAHGYRTIALESDCLRGLLVDDYVGHRGGTLDDVLAGGFSHGWGSCEANRELLTWMREFNEDRPEADRLRFVGFDGPLEISHAESPRHALTALHDHLAARVDADLLPCTADTLDRLIGDDGRWTDPGVMGDPARSVGRTPDADRLRLLADELNLLLDTQLPDLAAVSTPEELNRARLYGRTAVGLLRYHHAMADPTPTRLPRLLAVRDQMMARNLLDATERGPVFCYAHNSHLQRERSSMRMGGEPLTWWSAGALVSARLDARYAFLAMALGTIRHQGVDAPPPDTLEGFLYGLPERPAAALVDSRRLSGALAAAHGAAYGAGHPVPRVSPWFGYGPLDPAQLGSTDGLVFVRDAVRERNE